MFFFSEISHSSNKKTTTIHYDVLFLIVNFVDLRRSVYLSLKFLVFL